MENDSKEADAPLLRQSIHHDDLSPKHFCSHCQASNRSFLPRNALSIGSFLLLLYIAAMLTFPPDNNHRTPISSGLLLPVSDRFGKNLEFEEREAWLPLYDPLNKEWNRGPSQEVDRLWDELLHALNIRITRDEVEMLGLNTTNRIQVNGGDYLGVIGAYHHLHCLNNMRIAMHWDYYEEEYGNSSRLDVFGIEHTDHCIDTIRQALMCHANAEIHLAEWVESRSESKLLSGQSMTTCLKWDSLDNWARPRALIQGEYTYRPGPYEAETAP